MKSKTHIFVLRMKEIIYTAIFISLLAVLILLLIFMFRDKNHIQSVSAPIEHISTYTPGVYTSSISLGNHFVDVQVSVDENHVKHVELVYLDDAVSTMYPLLGNCVNTINSTLNSGSTLDQITGDSTNQYTLQVLINAIDQALTKAE